jgi:N-methylhydantoinase A
VRGHAFETRRRILALRSIATRPVGDIESANPTSAHACAGEKPERQHPMQHRIIATAPSIECPVFSRESLRTGTRLTGPALIDALDTTIWLPPGWTCTVAHDETLILAAVEQTP